MIVCTETVFTLHTTHTSYQLAVAPNGMVLHTYYGTRLPEDVPSLADARMPHSDPGCWPDLLPQELSGCGTADNRTPAVIPEYADGTEAAAFVFDHAVVTPGKPQLPGLNARPRLVLAGLDPAAQYRDEENNTYAGAQLLTTGLELPGGYGQMPAKIWYLKKV